MRVIGLDGEAGDANEEREMRTMELRFDFAHIHHRVGTDYTESVAPSIGEWQRRLARRAAAGGGGTPSRKVPEKKSRHL